MAALLAGLPALLDAALTAPGTPVAGLPTLPPAEAERIARTVADGGPAEPDEGLVHEIVARIAESAPERPAVVWDEGTLSYGDLWQRVRALAARLHQLGVERDEPVAVCLPRSPELIVAVYAVLLAGGAYLPLDTAHPRGPPGAPAGRLGRPRAHRLRTRFTPPDGTVLVGPDEGADLDRTPRRAAGTPRQRAVHLGLDAGEPQRRADDPRGPRQPARVVPARLRRAGR
ncbi:AMP-binding protein [Streptomyces sp. KL116D]|uniref:AMP-binding protein n=1 Tax=Streptomyces sp. KL116D TaxID=3045152 RepID=UPI0035568653